MMQKWRNRLLNLSLLAASLLACLLLLEGAARLYDWYVYERALARQARPPAPGGNFGAMPAPPRAIDWDAPFDPAFHVEVENEALGFKFRPNQRLDRFVSTNAHGFRDTPFAEAKPDEVYRIAVVGDSVAYGWDVPFEESFTTRLERLLNTYAGGRVFEVYNMAVSGYDALQEAELVRTEVFRFQPDLLLIGYCVNDHFIGNDLVAWRQRTRGGFHAVAHLPQNIPCFLALWGYDRA